MRNTIWTEKHRPKTLEEMALPSEVEELFRELLSGSRSLPNLLLAGPPGSGKTSLALILTAQLVPPENVLELNASSDREIAVIRGKIKVFAESKAHLGELKLIIMDECDYLTPDAQHCLRRIIEDTQASTRFIFITNYVNRVIEPIKSRLVTLKIPGPGRQASLRVLASIQQREQLAIPEADLEYLLDLAAGDMRRAIVLLQTAGQAQAVPSPPRTILSEVSGVVPPELIDRLCQPATLNDAVATIDAVRRTGYPALAIIQALSQRIAQRPPQSAAQLQLLHSLAKYEETALAGGAESIQLAPVVLRAAQINWAE